MSVYSDTLWEFKRALALRVLRTARGDVGKAARELGIHRNTMSRLIHETRVSVAGIRREFPAKPARPAYRAAKAERDPVVSAAELRKLEGPARGAYAQKMPTREKQANIERMFNLARKVG